MEFMEGSAFPQLLFRWIHFVAGVAWIGILYFFNLVNVNFMKTLDAPTKGKVIPNMMPAALWYFRWGAVVTVLSGFVYFAVWIVGTEGEGTHAALGLWLAYVMVAWAVLYLCIEVAKVNNGYALAAIVAVVAIAMSFLVAHHAGLTGTKSVSIGIGGGLGMLMFLNVWGIIWRHQKRIIAWTSANASGGTPIPAEAASLGRRAFLASRTNAWLSLPMLFFMGNSGHPWMTF